MPPNMSPEGLPEGIEEPVPLERLVYTGAFGGGSLNGRNNSGALGGAPLNGGRCFHLGDSEDEIGPVVASDDDEAAFGGGPTFL